MVAIFLLLALQIPLGLDHGLLAPPENPLTADKVALGQQLFFDKRISVDNSLACADCHQPHRAFTDGRRNSIGISGREGDRNTPTIINRAYGRSFFWDGRISTLEEQVLQPIQSPKEMGAELSVVIAKLKEDSTYTSLFQKIFGTPADIRPLSYALASYVRTRLSGNSPYDRFEAGEKDALTELHQQGLRLFRGKARCVTCHSGSNFTDEEFHNTGVAWRQQSRDPGRLAITGHSRDEGKFKTPTLRDIELTAPYMHDGSLTTLEEVIEFYDRGGIVNANLDRDIRPLNLTPEEKRALRSFLSALTGKPSAP